MDARARALAALFRAPGSAAADYVSASGITRSVRVIVSQPDQQVGFGKGRIIEGSASIEIQRTDVLKPVPGELIVLVDTTIGRTEDGGRAIYKIYGEPRLDTEGMTWTCGAVAA